MVMRKRLLTCFLALMLLASCVQPAFASLNWGNIFDHASGMDENASDARWTGSLNDQLDELYHRVGEELNIDYLYVKMLHLIAGGKAVYADSYPDIYVDQTVTALAAPFGIEGAKQVYDREAPWVECPDSAVVRSSGYYLPDAAYNVAADVVAIMNIRYAADRGVQQEYFDLLKADVKRNILFGEAVLQYMGETEAADNYFAAYLKILEAKERYSNVLLVRADKTCTLKDTYAEILFDCGISSERACAALTIILGFDATLAASSGVNSVSSGTVLPYELNYTSRENMMLAAMSLVGKCRYVWGGGHLGTGCIEGINPMWKLFSDAYGTEEGEPGYTQCIVPDGSWCPLHGWEDDWDGCLYTCKTSYSYDRYLAEREDVLDLSKIDTDHLRSLVEPVVNFEVGLTSHRLDGLDCSGYTTWLFNQITDEYTFDAGALHFIGQYGIRRLSVGRSLLPGDLYSWGDHIVVIVAAVESGSKAYVMLESGPSNVKFGVVYYYGAASADIELALQVAEEANQLLGNLTAEEQTRKFSMSMSYSGASPSDPMRGYRACGRLWQTFEDQDVILENYGKTITELTARELIQHIIDIIPYQYLSGMDSYTGELFSLERARENMAVAEVGLPDYDNIVLIDELN